MISREDYLEWCKYKNISPSTESANLYLHLREMERNYESMITILNEALNETWKKS